MITRRFHLACEMVRANKMLVCGACSHMQAKHLSDFSTASNYQFSYNPIDIQKRFHGRHRYTNPDVMPSALHNVQSIRAKWVERFRDMQIPEPDVSAELIVAHVLGCQTVGQFLVISRGSNFPCIKVLIPVPFSDVWPFALILQFICDPKTCQYEIQSCFQFPQNIIL